MSNIEKLPKWAQDHIRNLTRERDTAVRALNEWADRQTETSIYFEDVLSLGEKKGPSFKRVYVQSREITFDHLGINLNVRLCEKEIRISYGGKHRSLEYALLVPVSFQQFELRPLIGGDEG